MKMSVKYLSLVMAILMMCGTVSCAESSSEDTDEPAASSEIITGVEETLETREYKDDISDELYFDDLTVKFIVSHSTGSIMLLENDDESDIVNEAVWKRNQKMEERLGIKVDIPLGAKTEFTNFNSIVRNSITASSDDFDIMVGHTRFNITLASEGLLKNLNNFEHLDFDKEYWSKSYIDNVNYKDSVYWATGDLSLEYIKYIYCIFVNSSMWDDRYSNEDIYDIVREGKWTLDMMRQYSENTYVDANGNGVADNDDVWGIMMQKGHFINGMAFAANVVYTDYDEEGKPYVAINSEHTVDVFNALHSLFYDTKYGRMIDLFEYDGLVSQIFPMRKLLFCPNLLLFAEDANVRNMEDNFQIVPMPKYDEEQSDYRSNQYDGVPIYGVPITAALSKTDAIGAALEAMCSMSHTMVLPVYYDKAMKNKYSRDPETAEMIDLVHDSVTSDFSFAWGDTIGELYTILYENIEDSEIASTLKSKSKIWKISMEKLLEKLERFTSN